MKEVRVWYQYYGSERTGSMTLTVIDNDLMSTIREFESRNWDMRITHYLNEDNDVVAVEDEGFKGYYGIDADGNRFHTWDYEESIGE